MQFSVDREQDCRVENPRHEHMCVISSDRLTIRNTQLVQSCFVHAACGVDREQDDPDQDSAQPERGHDEQVPQEEVTVDTTVLDDEGWFFRHQCSDPGDGGQRKFFRSFIFGQDVAARLWFVDSFKFQSQQQEERHENCADDTVGNDGRDNILCGCGSGVGHFYDAAPIFLSYVAVCLWTWY